MLLTNLLKSGQYLFGLSYSVCLGLFLGKHVEPFDRFCIFQVLPQALDQEDDHLSNENRPAICTFPSQKGIYGSIAHTDSGLRTGLRERWDILENTTGKLII